MPRLFGTDGVRALANGDLLTPDLALRMAQSAAVVFSHGRTARRRRALGKRPMAVVARDPRISGEFLVAAVSAGLASSGVDVLDAGIVPTPTAAYLVKDSAADFGIMVSASHNPSHDNGIKIFARGGKKLSDEVEDRIERFLDEPKLRPTGADVGRISRFVDAEDRYQMHLLATLPKRLDGLSVVIDCANGASAGISPDAFRRAGARVSVIGADPDGLNINRGVGSNHLERLRTEVIRRGADLGIAHDGDADRCLAVDGNGAAIGGDQFMVILARSMQQRGILRNNTVVGTVMSNLGLARALEGMGINFLPVQVGDRYVVAAMEKGDFNLGGEQSGHIVMSDYSTTGDGILSGLHLAAEMVRTGQSLEELARIMEVYPQVMLNIPAADPASVHDFDEIMAAVARAEEKLKDAGRVLLRPSGTEPLVRVMVEARDLELAEELCEHLAEVVRQTLPASSELAQVNLVDPVIRAFLQD